MSKIRSFAFAVAIGLVAVLVAHDGALAQVDKPGLTGGSVVGSTPGLSVDTNSSSMRFGSSRTPQRHMDSSGRPCVYVLGEAKSQVVNPKLYDHVLIVNNSCSVPVKLRACYLGTDKCNDIAVGAYTKRREIFGIVPDAKDFRFEFREYFN
ncbi:hypothetical protein [Bradyrhizobium betae]|uniref:Uncharacterized protein n=1 Tax=Bradyrhizobium betae TaxID=244734 RepID=A0A4Q1VBE5_9BRAD|nr:hypothetical protein [Bradyrhizobium betae]RXT47704.1 hypothetical protein B5V03_15645 [Bradyrhizobium betae]